MNPDGRRTPTRRAAMSEDQRISIDRAHAGPSAEARREPVAPLRQARARGSELEFLAIKYLLILGALAIGGARFFQDVSALSSRSAPPLSPDQRALAWIGAVATFVAYALAGLAGGWLVAVIGRLMDLVNRHARTAEETSEALRRIVELLEQSPAAPANDLDNRAVHLAEIRHAIRDGRWDEAGRLLRSRTEADQPDPEAARLATELAEAKDQAAKHLRASIEAARAVNDPERVIELREALRPVLEADAMRALNGELAKWFMTLIHRRLRAGTVRADVAVLAARVADSFDDTPEGASLRASLPTLRRAAGLCARCGQPYVGFANACPTCLSGAPLPAPPFSPAPDEPEDSIQPHD
jgi:hypothetical protein